MFHLFNSFQLTKGNITVPQTYISIDKFNRIVVYNNILIYFYIISNRMFMIWFCYVIDRNEVDKAFWEINIVGQWTLETNSKK